ncbi:NAD(P)-binding protein [Aureobasidium pullulans]|nr:NAD(P)-binding protein [Aureobasidium pullulans]
MRKVSALTTDILSLFTPSTTILLLSISTLYSITLSPHPHTPSFSLDYLLHLTSILFPPLPYIYFLAISYILTLLAISKPIHATPFLIAVWYTILYGIRALNTRFGNGKARKVVWGQQIAVVTGGAGGLGWMIAEVLERKGCGVVVWDVKKPDEWTENEDEEGIRWYKVDVGDAEAVEKAYEKVKRDLGTPTILINNAGIVNGLPLLSLTPSQYTRTFNINTLSHFHSCRTFLPAMLAAPLGGTIVTVSSVLGHLGASHLTDYTASKAALLAFHTSLSAEIASLPAASNPGAENIRMVLVKPGQLSTNMFSTLKSPSDFFGPVVAAKDLAMEIVDAVERGRNEVLCMPVYAWLVEWLGVLPVSLQRVARWASGVDGAMESFGGGRKRD